RKRLYVDNDGYPREVTPLEKVLMTLLYLRHNVRHEVVGAMFGYSADTSENAFHEVVPLLRELFPSTTWEAEKKWQRSAPEWTPDDVDLVIVDSFETPTRRPSINERQKRIYSGKKKRHTIKTQVITDQDGELLTIAPGHRGPKADLKLYEETGLPAPLAGKPCVGDKAYQSSAHPEMTTPHKKPKGGTLTDEQRDENKQLAAKRVHVEHGIRRLKAFRILRDEYRLATGLFPMVASAVVGLIQFSRIMT
ncbi:MAG: transposase, partial [Pyrinomonadaceae bacterium]|nr:transposase [Pyrinomonadaceae bacterium]